MDIIGYMYQKRAKTVIEEESRASLKIALQFCPSGRATADKRLRYASPKLPSATSYIRKTLDCVKTQNSAIFLPYFSI